MTIVCPRSSAMAEVSARSASRCRIDTPRSPGRVTSLGEMSLLARYREVLGLGGAAQALVFSLVGRLSLGMTGLAILLLVREVTGSYASAGAVSAAYAISFAVASPSRARSADRRGPVRV